MALDSRATLLADAGQAKRAIHGGIKDGSKVLALLKLLRR